MSLSSSGIHFSGLSSGIDVESIVSQMISLEQIPVRRMQAQQAQLQARQTIFSQFRSTLIALSSAASSLNSAGSFKVNKASTSNKDVATVSVTEAAVPGSYAINVSSLATAHKLTSTPQVGSTDPLGMNGSFLLNGKLVDVKAEDTLTSIAAKINAADAKVSANVVSGGPDQNYLVLGANATGSAAQIQISEVNGSLATSLGLIGAGSFVTSLTGSVAKSAGFLSPGVTLESIFGTSKVGSFSLGSDVINFDTAIDSLQSIADKINATGNHSASIVSEKINGVDMFRLSIDSTAWPSSYSDGDGLLANLGVIQSNYANQIIAAADAALTVDGIPLTSKSNTLTNVVGGMTINIASTGTTTVTVERDAAAVKSKVKSFQDAYNNVISFIRDNSAFDSETYESGALFGDSTAAQIENSLSSMLFESFGTGALKNLAQIGFSLDDKGKIQLDEAKLDQIVADQPEELRKLMMATGTSTNASIGYVSSSSKTRASATGYQVEITQLATKSSVTGLNAFSAPAAGGEILTFAGSIFGSSEIALSISAGSTLVSVINQINSDSRLKDHVVASDDSGVLKIESKRWGSAGRFTVTSNLPEGPDNSGIGTAGGVTSEGLDVAGTIHGEPATGNGQFLLGNSGNANTDGLQIQYTGNSLGIVGSMIFSQGVSGGMLFRVSSFTDSVNGLLSTVDKSLTDQVEDIQSKINRLNEQVKMHEENLRKRFAAMEEAISRMNSQGSQLAAILTSR